MPKMGGGGWQEWDRDLGSTLFHSPSPCLLHPLHAQEALCGPTCSPSRASNSLGLGLAPAWRG